MSWRDRLRDSMTLVSPGGKSFTALWSKNQRSYEKKLGIFTYPKFKGVDVQDLDVGGDLYPLTIFFEGEDHDIDANNFFEACKENGPWQITHPVIGELELQLISVAQTVDPTSSGNITQFDTEWIQPISPERIRSTQQLGSDITQQSNNLNAVASSQFEKSFQGTFAETATIESTINEVTAVISKTLSPIYQQSGAINNRMLSVFRSVQDLISQPALDLAGIAGQIQNLIELPLLAVIDVKSRLSAYSSLFDGIFGSTDSDTGAVITTGITAPSDNSHESFNIAAVREITAVANIGAIAQIAASSFGVAVSGIPSGTEPLQQGIQTRAQAIETAEIASQTLIDTTNELDSAQELFESADIQDQYFSQSESFNDGALITAQAIAFLLSASFDLKKEKRFVLKIPKAPIAITIEEYGNLGENDENFDLFISSNQLKANEILLLPAGREVLVYV